MTFLSCIQMKKIQNYIQSSKWNLIIKQNGSNKYVTAGCQKIQNSDFGGVDCWAKICLL